MEPWVSALVDVTNYGPNSRGNNLKVNIEAMKTLSIKKHLFFQKFINELLEKAKTL